jgi:hypothetical protein
VRLAAEVGTLDVHGSAERTLGAGDWLLPAGSDREFHNAGNGLAILFILTVTASDD